MLQEESQTWGENNITEVSIEQLDESFKAYVEARNDYEEKKKISGHAHAIYQELEQKFINLLESSGKTKWEVEGLGKCSENERVTFMTPKTVAHKQELAKYIEEVHGKEAFWDLFSVNSMTLNSFVKAELENNPHLAKLPGLSDPARVKKLRLSRSKK